MKLEDFRRTAEIYQRKQLLVCLPAILAPFIGMAVFVPFHERIRDWLTGRLSPIAVDVVALLPVAVVLTASIALIIPLNRHIERTYALPCLHCGKGLAAFKSIVIASRNCPHCGGRVLDQPVA